MPTIGMTAGSTNVPTRLAQEEDRAREALLKTIGWGVALPLIFCGWVLTTKDEVFNFGDDPKQRNAAIGLMLVAVFAYAGWAYAIAKLNRLAEPAVLSSRELRSLLGAVAIVDAALVLLALLP